MKKIKLLALATLLALPKITAGAVPISAAGPVTFNLQSAAQNLDYKLISLKTNHTATVTNKIYAYKSTTTNFTINASYILNLLTNSFKTNFPPGAKLVLRGGPTYFSFAVADKTGTNVLLNVSSVFSVTTKASIASGMENEIQTTTASNTSYSGNDTESYTVYETMEYDDSALSTADGTTTTFELDGILTTKYSRNLASDKNTSVVNAQAGGGGTIRGVENIVIEGTIQATLTGETLIF